MKFSFPIFFPEINSQNSMNWLCICKNFLCSFKENRFLWQRNRRRKIKSPTIDCRAKSEICCIIRLRAKQLSNACLSIIWSCLCIIPILMVLKSTSKSCLLIQYSPFERFRARTACLVRVQLSQYRFLHTKAAAAGYFSEQFNCGNEEKQLTKLQFA